MTNKSILDQVKERAERYDGNTERRNKELVKTRYHELRDKGLTSSEARVGMMYSTEKYNQLIAEIDASDS